MLRDQYGAGRGYDLGHSILCLFGLPTLFAMWTLLLLVVLAIEPRRKIPLLRKEMPLYLPSI